MGANPIPLIIIAVIALAIGGFVYFGAKEMEQEQLAIDSDSGDSGSGVVPPASRESPGPPDVLGDAGLPPPAALPPPPVLPPPSPTPPPPPPASAIKNISIAGRNFAFSLSEIRVRRGDTVRVTFKDEGGTHDWRLEGYAVGTPTLGTGQSASVQFVADKPGKFEFFCSVGNHRQLGMRGKFIVE